MVTKQLTVSIDFHSMEKNTMEVNGNHKLLDYPHSSKYVILCLSEERNSYRFEMTLKQIYLTEATLFDYPVINFLIICKM